MKTYILTVEYRKGEYSNGFHKIPLRAYTRTEAMIYARTFVRQHRPAVFISLRLQEEKINTAK
jgi:hypothetical protein